MKNLISIFAVIACIGCGTSNEPNNQRIQSEQTSLENTDETTCGKGGKGCAVNPLGYYCNDRNSICDTGLTCYLPGNVCAQVDLHSNVGTYGHCSDDNMDHPTKNNDWTWTQYECIDQEVCSGRVGICSHPVIHIGLPCDTIYDRDNALTCNLGLHCAHIEGTSFSICKH